MLLDRQLFPYPGQTEAKLAKDEEVPSVLEIGISFDKIEQGLHDLKPKSISDGIIKQFHKEVEKIYLNVEKLNALFRNLPNRTSDLFCEFSNRYHLVKIELFSLCKDWDRALEHAEQIQSEDAIALEKTALSLLGIATNLSVAQNEQVEKFNQFCLQCFTKIGKVDSYYDLRWGSEAISHEQITPIRTRSGRYHRA